MNIFDIKKT